MLKNETPRSVCSDCGKALPASRSLFCPRCRTGEEDSGQQELLDFLQELARKNPAAADPGLAARELDEHFREERGGSR